MPDENAATTETAAVAAATATPTPTPTATETPAGVTLTPEMFKEITAKLSRLDQIEADSARKVKEAEDRALAKSIENADVKQALALLKENGEKESARVRQEESAKAAESKRLADEAFRRAEDARVAAENRAKSVEQKAKKTAIDRAVTDALNANADKLAPHATKFLTKHWSDQFTAVEDGEGYAARTMDGRAVLDFVSAMLASEEYGGFIKAASRGGGTATPGANNATTSTPTPTPTGTDLPEPKNMGEAVVRYMQGQKKAAGDATGNMALGMGLKPLAR